jgi:hypothetical protein
MSRWATKTLVLCLLVTLGIFLGVDVATRGVETIHGPFYPDQAAAEQVPQVPAEPAEEPPHPEPEAPAPKEARGGEALAALQGKQTLQRQSNLDRFADKTGKLLQFTAQHGIEWFVSVFDGLLD